MQGIQLCFVSIQLVSPASGDLTELMYALPEAWFEFPFN